MSSPGLISPRMTSRPPYQSKISEVLKATNPILGPKNEEMMTRFLADWKLSSMALPKRSFSSLLRTKDFTTCIQEIFSSSMVVDTASLS